MTEQSWTPLFRTPESTVTKVLRSSAFVNSRERAGTLIDEAAALRELGHMVEALDHVNPPLAAVADRVAAAVCFLRTKADHLDSAAAASLDAGSLPEAGAESALTGGRAARERLIVAALHYLVTPVDLVPDFRPGGYIDDVLLLSWVFGAAVTELEPFLVDDAGPSDA